MNWKRAAGIRVFLWVFLAVTTSLGLLLWEFPTEPARILEEFPGMAFSFLFYTWLPAVMLPPVVAIVCNRGEQR